MATWRFRRCPECKTVAPAGDFTCVDFGAQWQAKGYARRRCPSCGHVAATRDFRIVRPVATPRTERRAPMAEPVKVDPPAAPWWAK